MHNTRLDPIAILWTKRYRW